MTLSRLRRRRALTWAAAASTAAAAAAAAAAPQDAAQGQAQRLMYVHVPAAWLAYVSFVTVLVASVGYLLCRDLRWDARARAAAELGVGATALAVVLGSLWGRPVWGVWWVWDPRLVTTTVLFLVYVGYLGVRGISSDGHVNARRAAAVGIVGFADIPVVHFSVVWWRGVHQPPTLLQPGTAPPIDGRMLAALLLSVAAFTLLGALVYARRVDVLLAACKEDSSPAKPADRGPVSPGAATPGSAQRVHVTAGGGR